MASTLFRCVRVYNNASSVFLLTGGSLLKKRANAVVVNCEGRISVSFVQGVSDGVIPSACTLFTSATSLRSSNQHDDGDSGQSKALVLLSDLKQLRSSPRPALMLGFFGLLPIALPPFYFIYSGQFVTQFASMQLSYGAGILLFIAGVKCGNILTSVTSYNPLEKSKNTSSIVWSMITCLVGWVSMYLPLSGGLVSQMVAHGMLVYHDMDDNNTFPSWLRALRFVFALLTILLLWTTCVCRFALHERGKNGPNEVKI